MESFPQQQPEGKKELPELKKLILTNEQFRGSAFVESGQRTYEYRIEVGGKVLQMFGTYHINRVDDPVVTQIEQSFNEAEPDIVLVEGINGLQDREGVLKHLNKQDRETTIGKGEAMFVLKLAAEKNEAGVDVDFESPEPKFSDEIHHLEDLGFNQEDIFRFYYYRDVDQFLRYYPGSNAEALEEYSAPYIEEFKRESGWNDFELMRIIENVKEPVNFSENRYHSLVDPIPWPEKNWTITNEISAQSSRFRDNYILERIIKAFDHHSRVFVVYGSGHAVKLEPAVRAFMENRG